MNPSEYDTRIKRFLATTILRAGVWVPELKKFGEEISEALKDIAYHIPTLNDWNPNRFGINFMNGFAKRPAKIAEHTDVPEEHGVVVVAHLTPSNKSGIQHTKNLFPIVDNLSFIFGADTCEYFGVDQHPHSEIATQRQLSATVADLRLNPDNK